MKIALSPVIAILAFATVYIACICDKKWYKITISAMMALLITVLTWM